MSTISSQLFSKADGAIEEGLNHRLAKQNVISSNITNANITHRTSFTSGSHISAAAAIDKIQLAFTKFEGKNFRFAIPLGIEGHLVACRQHLQQVLHLLPFFQDFTI